MFYINLICVSAIDLPFSPRLSLSSPPEGGGANLGGLIFPTGGLCRGARREAQVVAACTSPPHPATRDASQNHIFVHICGARSGPTRSEFRRLCREWALLSLRGVLGTG